MKTFNKTTWRSWWVKYRNLIVLKWSSLTLVLGSLLYGFEAVVHPEIFIEYVGYQLLTNLINYRWLGVIFIVLSLLKTIGIFINHKRIKHFSVTALTTVWSLVLLSLLANATPNTVYILPVIMVATAIGVNMKD